MAARARRGLPTVCGSAGRFLINTFRVLENLDTHPAADRLLLNMIGYAQRFTLEEGSKQRGKEDKTDDEQPS